MPGRSSHRPLLDILLPVIGKMNKNAHSKRCVTNLRNIQSSSAGALIQNEGGEAIRFWHCPSATNTFSEEPR